MSQSSIKCTYYACEHDVLYPGLIRIIKGEIILSCTCSSTLVLFDLYAQGNQFQGWGNPCAGYVISSSLNLVRWWCKVEAIISSYRVSSSMARRRRSGECSHRLPLMATGKAPPTLRLWTLRQEPQLEMVMIHSHWRANPINNFSNNDYLIIIIEWVKRAHSFIIYYYHYKGLE